MQIKYISRDNEGEALLIGKLDSQAAVEAEPILMDLAEKNDRLILNLAELDYTASSGLRIIKNLQVKMMRKDGDLIVKKVNPMVMEVFEMTGFASFLNIVSE